MCVHNFVGSTNKARALHASLPLAISHSLMQIGSGHYLYTQLLVLTQNSERLWNNKMMVDIQLHMHITYSLTTTFIQMPQRIWFRNRIGYSFMYISTPLLWSIQGISPSTTVSNSCTSCMVAYALHMPQDDCFSHCRANPFKDQ